MSPRHALLTLMLAVGVAACSQSNPPSPADSDPRVARVQPAPSTSTPTAAGPLLTLQLDGVAWQADREIWGAVHPPGMGQTVIMSGSFGPKDAHEQAFNLNLHAATQPGTYRLQSTAPAIGMVQLANLSQERYLMGNVLGYDIEVELLQMQVNPVRIEARFEGSLVASDGATLKLTAGHFRYSE
ncbi:hypothetical protein [Aquimonas sp.]|jgi:hypothetical protein|uniref:hypothetical protein n=1 Tax=Aquimonas sp. TaxID=1872588 RepID=UPI0037C0B161